MRAIIVAAGMGTRLSPYTEDRPKAMVDVNGRSILARQIEAYREAGVDEFCVVRGYCSESVNLPGIRYFENPDYRHNNILASLFCAEEAMEGGFLFSYSDIVFRKQVTRDAVAATADYALVIDRRWEEIYEGRDQHPISEAEVARVSDGRVLRVGKRTVPREESWGEFIGLARFSAAAARTLRETYRALEAELAPGSLPFGTAPRFQAAYLTDLLNHLIDRGVEMRSVDIDGGWREIDTTQDLERARAIV